MPASPTHVEDMRRLFAPVGNRCRAGDTTVYLEMIRRFEADLAANREGHTGFVYRALGQSLDRRSHPAALPIVEELLRGANILESDDQESTGISPVLYHEVNKELVAEARAAAADRRLAAWLVMSRKEGAAGIVRDPRTADRFALLSMQLRRWARREKKQDLLDEIRAYQRAVAAARSSAETVSATAFGAADAQHEIARLNLQVKLHKEEAKALRDEGDLAGAIDALQDVVTTLTASPFYADLLSSSQPASGPEQDPGDAPRGLSRHGRRELPAAEPPGRGARLLRARPHVRGGRSSRREQLVQPRERGHAAAGDAGAHRCAAARPAPPRGRRHRSTGEGRTPE